MRTTPAACDTVLDYRIEKVRLAITLTLEGGESVSGDIFVPPLAFPRSWSGTPIDLFNDPDPFFPIEQSDGSVLLVAKQRVVEIAGITAPPDDEIRRAGAHMALLEITLVGGARHFGSMRLEVRSDRPRLLDFLNDASERFLTLYTDKGVRLINRALIDRVRPLD